MIRLSKRRWLHFIRTRRQLATTTFATVFLLIIAVVTIVVTHGHQTPHSAAVPKNDINRAGVVIYSADKPATAAVRAASYTSTMTGQEPAYISLPSIKAQGYIQKVGIDQYSHMAVPTNIHLAGWYVDSVLPGDKGLSIINGHIDIPSDPGIFQHLASLMAGDNFELKLANGTVQTYVVSKVETLPLAQVPAVLFSQSPGISRQLNLITCDGSYNSRLKTFNERIVVIAKLSA
jgi:LPXTG-site transpeptidase (sortase) family protein